MTDPRRDQTNEIIGHLLSVCQDLVPGDPRLLKARELLYAEPKQEGPRTREELKQMLKRDPRQHNPH